MSIHPDHWLQQQYPGNEPGLAIGLVSEGRVILQKGYGMAELDTGQSITASTLLNIASLTKQFTAAAIATLITDYRLSLTESVSRWFPELHPGLSGLLTIGHLLCHQSGLPDHYSAGKSFSGTHATDATVLEAIRQMQQTDFVPGTQFRYSNTAYCLLGMLVQRVTGIGFTDYLEQRVLAPAGMTTSLVWREDRPLPVLATGYEKNGSEFRRSGPDENPFFSTEADGGLHGCINDYLSWFAQWQPGIIQPQVAIDQNRQLWYGWGWFLDLSQKETVFYHSGCNGGFRSYVYAVPAKGQLLLLLSNRADKDIETLAFDLLRITGMQKKAPAGIQALTN